MKCYVIETSPAVPWQLEGICEDGKYIYVRERGGVLKVRVNNSASELYRSKPVLIREVGNEYEDEEVLDIIKRELGRELIIVGEAWGK